MGKGKSRLSLTILEVRTFITEDSIMMERILAAVISFDSIFLSGGRPPTSPWSEGPGDLTKSSAAGLWG